MCSCYTAPDANLQRSINEDFWDARLNYGQMWDTEQDEMIWTCGRMTTNKNQTDDKYKLNVHDNKLIYCKHFKASENTLNY